MDIQRDAESRTNAGGAPNSVDSEIGGGEVILIDSASYEKGM